MSRAALVLGVLAPLAVALAPAQAQESGPNDAQIAAIVVAANQVDVDAGQLAKAKAHSQEVRQFAQQMVTDHTGVNQSATQLVKKLQVTPQPNATSDSLTKGGEQNVAQLKSLQGTEFDRAYVAHEIDYHQQVLDALDKTLIPSARNAELKALLVKVRPAFVAHLQHARQLLAGMGK